jgi:hypothetical protein
MVLMMALWNQKDPIQGLILDHDRILRHSVLHGPKRSGICPSPGPRSG